MTYPADTTLQSSAHWLLHCMRHPCSEGRFDKGQQSHREPYSRFDNQKMLMVKNCLQILLCLWQERGLIFSSEGRTITGKKKKKWWGKVDSVLLFFAEALFNPVLKKKFNNVDADSNYLVLSTNYILVSMMLET